MADRIADIESRLGSIESRLRTLEVGIAADSDADVTVQPSLSEGFVANASTQIGRVLLIFGGAYLLRAITDADFRFIPTAVGLLFGAGYALFWLYMAYRKGRLDGQRASAMFYGGTSILLAMPLLVEAVTRFGLLSGVQGLIALAILCALALAVAALRDLRSLGWLVIGGGVATAFAIMIAAHAAIATVVFLLALGLGSLWLVWVKQWHGMQWLGALGANAGVLSLSVLGDSERWVIDAGTAALFGMAAVLAYGLSFALSAQILRRDLGWFETLQGLAITAIAFLVAGAAVASGDIGLLPMGTFVGVLGLAAYGLALTPRTRSTRGRNFYYFSYFGLLLVVAGTALVLPPVPAAALWSVLAVTMAWFSGRTGWVALSLQCTLLLLAAGFRSGLLATGLFALAGDAALTWPELLPWHIGIALATVACLFLPVAQHSERWGAMAGLPQLLVLALSVWEVGGLIVVIAAGLFAGAASASPNLGMIAAVRTVVLAAASVTLAVSSRFRRWPEARWLVYPVLVVVGIKLFVEDLPQGEPAALFVALGFVGGALLLVTRILGAEPYPPGRATHRDG